MTLAPPRPAQERDSALRSSSLRPLVRRAWASPRAAAAAALAVVLGWLLLPTSNSGVQSVGAWADQSVFGRAAQEVIATGSSPLSEQGYVGPAYLMAFRALRQVTSSDVPSGLVLLSRLSYLALFVALFSACFSLRDGRRGVAAQPAVLLGLAAVVLLTPWRLLSDIPWTHFPAAALVLATVVALRVAGRRPVAASAAAGAGVVLTLQTRMFEGRVLVLALLASGALHLVLRLRRRDLQRQALVRNGAAAAGGAVAAWLAVGLSTGYWKLFSQYANVWQSNDFVLSPKGLPTRAAQLFLDPCYRSLCTVNQYSPKGYLADTLIEYWRQPLLMQLPFLASAVLLLVAVLVLARAAGRSDVLRTLLPYDVQVSVLVAAGLLLGYSSNPIAGAGHLRYGFVRDFIAPYVLLVYAAARSTTRFTRDRRVPRRQALVLVVAAVVGLLPGLALPRLGSATTVDYRAGQTGCAADLTPGCRLDLRGLDAQGRAASIGDQAVVVVVCGTERVLTRIVRSTVSADVVDAYEACKGPTQVQYLANSLGFYQTPEGETMLAQHVLAQRR